MTTRRLFEILAPLVHPMLYEALQRRDLCILTTRLVLDVCQYFGVEARELAVRVIVYNRQFAAHVETGAAASYHRGNWPQDGSHSVGVGFGAPDMPPLSWDGHLIVVGPDCFLDAAIQQAERLERDIVTGPAVVCSYSGAPAWQVENNQGTTFEYAQTGDRRYLGSPDWQIEKRRRRLAGHLIRQAREQAGG